MIHNKLCIFCTGRCKYFVSRVNVFILFAISTATWN